MSSSGIDCPNETRETPASGHNFSVSESQGSRIFAVTDSFDAITSDRPYRRASPLETGRETIRRETGRLFDRQVVDVFLNIPAKTWRAVARDQRQGLNQA